MLKFICFLNLTSKTVELPRHFRSSNSPLVGGVIHKHINTLDIQNDTQSLGVMPSHVPSEQHHVLSLDYCTPLLDCVPYASIMESVYVQAKRNLHRKLHIVLLYGQSHLSAVYFVS